MGKNAREAAVKALCKAEKDGAYLGKAIIDELSGFDARDRGFINELVMGVIRNKTKLDYTIQSYSKIKLKKVSPIVLQIMRVAVYQLIMMDKVPPSAACNEAAKLAGKFAHSSAKGYVNGVLRTISRNTKSLPSAPKEDICGYLSIEYSCPEWLTKKLLAQFGGDVCEKLLADSLLPHPTMIRANVLKITPEELLDVLKEEGISARQSDTVPQCLIIDGAIDITASNAYKEGYYTLQNINSMQAVLALEPEKCETIIDVCAAPGGKTTFIAELMEDSGRVIGMDIHSHKIQLIEKAANRLGLSTVKAMVHNSEEASEELIGSADRVLADVPCSGIGVIHKKPDIKWNREEADITSLCETQRKILRSCAKYVKLGGVLVYSTCTVLKEENSDITDEFLLENKGFVKEFEKLYLAHETGGSGFYVCRMKRVGEN